MILAAHQPDLFPYPGFWVKMARADLFDLAIYDQFQTRGYQKRVKMGGEWASLAVQKHRTGARIEEIRLADRAVEDLMDTIIGRYRSFPLWRERHEFLMALMVDAWSPMLWQFNVNLILGVRDWLGIRTPVSIAKQPHGRGVDGLIDLCKQYRGVETYLSGVGGHAYMGEAPGRRFAAEGIGLRWMEYQSPTEDSILTLIFERENVLSALWPGRVVGP